MSKTQNASRTPREVALVEVDLHAETVGKWAARKSAAEQELASLQDRAGAEVLADESAAVGLTKTMGELRDEIDIASKALAAVQPLYDHAAREAVVAEAAEWGAEAAKRQKALGVHVAGIDRLLGELLEHDGVPYGALPRHPGSKRHHLELEVDRAKLTAFVLREVAEGRDPGVELQARASVMDGTIYGLDAREYYPASVWGPDAVLPAPAYLATVPAGD